ncbi:hypothetical protein PMI09_01576 [Rhizobium sp. CF122]|nr:hypothetical protein PMI09_01576 [Rhizobium sp. CF122]
MREMNHAERRRSLVHLEGLMAILKPLANANENTKLCVAMTRVQALLRDSLDDVAEAANPVADEIVEEAVQIVAEIEFRLTMGLRSGTVH